MLNSRSVAKVSWLFLNLTKSKSHLILMDAPLRFTGQTVTYLSLSLLILKRIIR